MYTMYYHVVSPKSIDCLRPQPKKNAATGSSIFHGFHQLEEGTSYDPFENRIDRDQLSINTVIAIYQL